MNACPNCKSFDTEFVFYSNNAITYQNVLMDSRENALAVPRGEMELRFCNECTFLFNNKFDDTLVGYGEAYENDQSYSTGFQDHIDKMLAKISSALSNTRSTVLEIGCGNGYFLRKLISKNSGTKGVGYDTSLEKNWKEGSVLFHKKYYGEEDAGGFDIVLSRHVVEHIIDNNLIIDVLRRKNPAAKFMIETPSLEWIIENNVFFDIFYEHCVYFSEFSLKKLLERHNLKNLILERVFNGQYLWAETSEKKASSKKVMKILSCQEVKRFFADFQKIIKFYQNNFEEKYKNKKVVIWGAGAKGVTFANWIDPECRLVNCLVDINPKKQGKFLPGTGHKIISPSEIQNDKHDVILIMNSNYKLEIYDLLSNQKVEFVMVEDFCVKKV